MPYWPGRSRSRSLKPGLRWLLLCVLVVSGVIVWPRQSSRAMVSAWRVATDAGSTPPPRAQYGMAADAGGHIYLFGGNGGLSAPLNDFWQYDTGTGSWTALANNQIPTLIEPHLAVDSQGQVWEFGGITDPGGQHLTPDGHSYGLYVYRPAIGLWSDVTPDDAQPGVNWPQGREDHGFAYDSQADDLVVFAGETQGEAVLNDMWRYNMRSGAWTSVTQQYASPDGSVIAPREIYNVSADTHGHLYLFGGTYLAAPTGAGQDGYANDLWRFDDATQTWTLLAGIANGYDPAQPLPRHYYGQIVDAGGDFDILGGYVDDPDSPPFFTGDAYASYALPFNFAEGTETGTYGLSDFWRYNIYSGWHDESASLGPLAGYPMIPYNLVLDQVSDRLYTFGGFHITPNGVLDTSNGLWSWSESTFAGLEGAATPAAPGSSTPASTPGTSPTPVTSTHAAPTATPSPHGTARPGPAPARTATATATNHGAPAAPGMAPPRPGTVAASLAAGPYTLALAIGPPEQLYSLAQARALHPKQGELTTSGAPPPGAPAANHYLALRVYFAKTGSIITGIPVAVAVTTPGGRILQRIPVVVMQSIAAGPSDRHFGDNVALPMGHYHVAVRANQSSATFDVVVGA